MFSASVGYLREELNTELDSKLTTQRNTLILSVVILRCGKPCSACNIC